MIAPSPLAALASSFRDPSGFLFRHEGQLYRQVNPCYAADYDQLMGSGLYQRLVESGDLVPHEEVDPASLGRPEAYRVLRPAEVPFVSYPYEWCFSALHDAAALTLRVMHAALEHEMWLKDASAYNVQFLAGRPVFIDTLSFAAYREGEPWSGYRQFCTHFLAPLALMAYVEPTLNQLLRVHLDGVPLRLASRLLPLRTRLRPGLLTHVHLHAAAEARYAGTASAANGKGRVSRQGLLGILDSLDGTLRGLRLSRTAGTQWSGYYADNSYTAEAMADKERLVAAFLDRVDPAPCTVWDLGANTGAFSRIPAGRGIPTFAFDADAACVETAYRELTRKAEPGVLPLVLDLTNPSASSGWANAERQSLAERGPVDLAMALALVHHLAIGNNVPLPRVAAFFAGICRRLILEFVPKEDPQLQRLLRSRADIFPDYTREGLEAAFGAYFRVEAEAPVAGSPRRLYLLANRGEPGARA